MQRIAHSEEHPRHRHGGSVETNLPQLNPSMNFVESRKEERRGGEQHRDDGEGAGDSQEYRAREASCHGRHASTQCRRRRIDGECGDGSATSPCDEGAQEHGGKWQEQKP
ncbi:hypothetical protein BHS09_10380 [Myxococcus xanthus]|uniref:Uncharacterized protein n=1 Tax=Myxococcus xanthus TaxID=34 RepID=A0AAE6KRQ3_MYXXA|nr:hypothetical protein BHS09_10380 [Myxococcus xanthus]QDE74636.1 hypothetical protein BHS08_10395 [Myxococcus xanthus]